MPRVRRIVLTLVWLLCLPGLFGYFMLSFGALATLGEGGEIDAKDIPVHILVYASFVCGWVGWGCLLEMSAAWVTDRRLPRAWPIVGTVAALIGLLPLVQGHPLPAVLVSPGILLASYLSYWHVRKPNRLAPPPSRD